MRTLRIALLASSLLALSLVPAASAGQPPTRGIMPANANVHGYSMVDIANAWSLWAWGTAADENPLLAVRCEPSPIDPRIWFLPVSLGGEWEATCDVPPGTFLVLLPGGVECSNLEPEPFFGADAAELTQCAEDFFNEINVVEVTVNGTTVTDLDDYVFTTDVVTLPPNNLLSADSGISLSMGWWLVLSPMSRGTHTVRAFDASDTFGFEAGITITINVG